MIRRIVAVLATVIGLGIAGTGIANADVPVIFVGASTANAGDCIGVILDQDGHYNHTDLFGNGYDATLCAVQGGDTRNAFGWSHAGGYYIGVNHCVEEDDFVNNRWEFLRIVCTTTRSMTRFLDSTHFYKIDISK